MPERDASWPGSWLAEKLQAHPDVTGVDLTSAQTVRIQRKGHSSMVAATIAAARVEPLHVAGLLDSSADIEFVVNIPKESFWTGGAMALTKEHGVAYGGVGDLHRALRMEDPREYVNPDVAYVERGLRQHEKIAGFERIHDRKYVLNRRGMRDLTIVWLNEYELTADHVREARDRYGEFELLVRTNPNGRITAAAKEAVESMGAAAYDWKDFFGCLNRP